MRQLQGRDASFVARETPHSPMHIGSVLIYDPASSGAGPLDFSQIVRFVASRLHLSRTVRQRLVRVPFDLDYPYWVEDENFDLEYHLRHTALPAPGNWHQLCTLAARLFSRPLDLARPPWEFTVVEGLGDIPGVPPGSFAMITKVHHAAIDGLSGIDLMQAMHTTTPEAPPPPDRDRWRPEPVPTAGELIGRFLLNAVQHPVQRAQVAMQAAPGLVRIARGLLDKEFTIGEMVGPKTRFNAPLSAGRVVEGCRFPLPEIKKIRVLAPGAWVNDVFLALVGGALGRYLAGKDELPAKSLTSLVPISVRNKAEKGEMGNQVAAMIVPLGTHLADPTERLRYVHDRTQNSKAMTNAIGARNLSEISQASPALFLAMGAQLNAGLGFSKQMSPPYSTLVTNVPGPRRPIYFAGARLHTMMGLMCLTEGLGLAHVVQTYGGEATVSFTADRELMPDPRFYAACIAESFAEMVAAAEAAAPTRRRGKEAGSVPKQSAPELPSAPDEATEVPAVPGDEAAGSEPPPRSKPRRTRAEAARTPLDAEAASAPDEPEDLPVFKQKAARKQPRPTRTQRARATPGKS